MSTANPYLDAYRALPCSSPEYQELLQSKGQTLIEKQQLIRKRLAMDQESYRLRKELILKYSFAVPSDQAIAAVAECSPLVEIGAGTGYWANVLGSAGADVVAYDVKVLGSEEYDFKETFFDIREGGPERAGDHPDRTLFLCWPCVDKPWAFVAAKSHRDAGGKKLIYIGEYRGRTANSDFHTFLEIHCLRDKELALPKFPGIHDSLYFYTYKDSV